MNVTHLAWDLMVGSRHPAVPADAVVVGLLDLPKRHAEAAGGSSARRPLPGSISVITLEAGWTVSEVGRQPWIVYEKMKVEDAATANTGIWITFIGVVMLYIGLGITTILVLRMMSRRFRQG